MTEAEQRLTEVVRDERRRVLAALVRATGDWDLAEDAVQDAALRAWEVWRRDGVPDSPRAWLTVAARRRLIDVVRREALRTGKETESVHLFGGQNSGGSADDELSLIFSCCHPSLSTESQVALSLRALCGLTTEEVARALLVPVETMARRLTRAKQKIRQAGIPYRRPDDAELPDRLAPVCATVYLLFNEGYAAGSGEDHLRLDLMAHALYLAEVLTRLMPDEPSALGLLALIRLQHARRDARVGDAGRLVLLPDQDRSRWDRTAIRDGVELTGRALSLSPHRPDPYVVQAAIAACHALSPSWQETSWSAIVSWYDVLLSVLPTDVVRLNRAVAVAELDGARSGLDLLDEVTGLQAYALYHASRAELLVRDGRAPEAAEAYRRALSLETSPSVAAHLARRLGEVQGA